MAGIGFEGNHSHHLIFSLPACPLSLLKKKLRRTEVLERHRKVPMVAVIAAAVGAFPHFPSPPSLLFFFKWKRRGQTGENMQCLKGGICPLYPLPQEHHCIFHHAAVLIEHVLCAVVFE